MYQPRGGLPYKSDRDARRKNQPKTPKGDQCGCGLIKLKLTPKADFCMVSVRAPKSVIYTIKRDDEHPRHFYMGVFPGASIRNIDLTTDNDNNLFPFVFVMLP